MPSHDKPRGHRRRSNALDPGDMQAVQGFLLRTGIFVLYAVLPWLLGIRPPAEVPARLLMLFSMGALFAMVVALCLGEKAGRGRLNRWDEAMAFNGLALLVHLTQVAHPHG